MDEAKLHWRATMHRVYEYGDKSGKTLYWLATNGTDSRVVLAVLDSQGIKQENSHDISKVYYQALYAAVPTPTEEQRLSILGDVPLPVIPPSLAGELDRPLGLEELVTALADLNS